MKSTIVLGATALVLPTFGAFAQNTTAGTTAGTTADKAVANTATPAASELRNGFFASAEYSFYYEAGAPRELVTDEIYGNKTAYDSAIRFITALLNAFGVDATSKFVTHGNTPSGDLEGGTVGYFSTLANGDTWSVQANFLTGSVKTRVLDYSINYSVDADTSAWASGCMRFKEDIDEYHFLASYSPKRLRYLSFGLEYCYAKYDGNFKTLTWSSDSENVYTQDSGFSSESHDVVAHVSAKIPAISLLKLAKGVIFFTPAIDLGVGYSFRSGSIKDNDYFVTSDPNDKLRSDASVLEGALTAGISYRINDRNAANLDFGGFYKADMDDHFAADQAGYFVRAGYVYRW